jgi:uncharacterized protein YdeI (YjbR/CyaY-like superfamily)
MPRADRSQQAPPRFFRTATAFDAWMEKHHLTRDELLVGFHKKASGLESVTYQEALDAALAFGWIDGVRRRLDDDSYTIRFTPRRATSIWSAVNVKRVGELIATGRMRPAGLAAFAKRDPKKTAIYAYERAAAGDLLLDPAAMAPLKADKKAWAFFDAQAPWYKRTCAHWLVSAKREETRAKRLATLIECSRRGQRLPQLIS